jgi:hypothetical protein
MEENTERKVSVSDVELVAEVAIQAAVFMHTVEAPFLKFKETFAAFDAALDLANYANANGAEIGTGDDLVVVDKAKEVAEALIYALEGMSQYAIVAKSMG